MNWTAIGFGTIGIVLIIQFVAMWIIVNRLHAVDNCLDNIGTALDTLDGSLEKIQNPKK